MDCRVWIALLCAVALLISGCQTKPLGAAGADDGDEVLTHAEGKTAYEAGARPTAAAESTTELVTQPPPERVGVAETTTAPLAAEQHKVATSAGVAEKPVAESGGDQTATSPLTTPVTVPAKSVKEDQLIEPKPADADSKQLVKTNGEEKAADDAAGASDGKAEEKEEEEKAADHAAVEGDKDDPAAPPAAAADASPPKDDPSKGDGVAVEDVKEEEAEKAEVKVDEKKDEEEAEETVAEEMRAEGEEGAAEETVLEQKVEEKEKVQEKPQPPVRYTLKQSEETGFMGYMLFFGLIVAVFYVVQHNKKKILGLMFEGRSAGDRRRSANGARYRRLSQRDDDDDGEHVIY